MLSSTMAMADPLSSSSIAKPITKEQADDTRQHEIFHLEEITHFTRPPNLLPSNPFATAYQNGNSESAPQPISASFPIIVTKAGPSHYSNSSEDDESETEFDKRFRKLKPNQHSEPSQSQPTPSTSFHFFERETVSADENEDSEQDDYYEETITKTSPPKPVPISNSNFRHSGDSFNLPSLNAIQVRAEDLLASLTVFLVHLLSFIIDLSLVIVYYRQDWNWSSALTCVCMFLGGIGILHQFSLAEKDRLDRLFKHGRRVRILINCFPPCGAVISSYYCLRSAWKARRDQMFSVKFFALEEFSQTLTRVQGFFQAATQATLQLVILMENVEGISVGQGTPIIASIMLSLTIMTIANLPGREEVLEDSIRRGVHVPVSAASRLFLGLRMISSFGSRTMAIGYFFMGLRCLLGSALTFPSILFGLSALLFPRLLFASIDYCYHRQRVRRGREAAQGGRLSCCGTFTGYLATLCYPMGEPKWIFWFIWVETGVFMLWGNIAAWSVTPCLSNAENALYTGVFCLTFLVIPILLPYARASIKQSRLKKLEEFFEPRSQEDGTSTSETTTTNNSTDSV